MFKTSLGLSLVQARSQGGMQRLSQLGGVSVEGSLFDSKSGSGRAMVNGGDSMLGDLVSGCGRSYRGLVVVVGLVLENERVCTLRVTFVMRSGRR